MALLTIASLTLREAMRRRIVLVAGGATFVVVIGAAWGLSRLVASLPSRTAGLALVAALSIFLAFVFSVVLSVGAAFLASPAIAGDIDSGVALAILPRPLSRADYVLGKWLALALLLAAYAFFLGGFALFAIAIATGYRPPHPLTALAFLAAQSIATLSLALLFSTRLPTIASGLLAVVCFGAAWIAGIAANVAAALHNAGVLGAATIVGLLLPSDGLWRGALFALEPVALLVAGNASGRSGQNPFAVTAPPAPAFIGWSAAWIAVAVLGAVASFVRRDV